MTHYRKETIRRMTASTQRWREDMALPRRPLDAAMKEYLKDWKSDLPLAWKSILSRVELNFGAASYLQLKSNETVFPLRKGHRSAVAPAGSHLLKALDAVDPEKVRAVLLGQDPYPDLAKATGRSFEQGNLTDWSKPGEVAPSFKNICQALVYHRAGSASASIEAPQALFDRWGREGVLCLNAGLSFSRKEAMTQQAHIHLWKPLVREIFIHLVRRPACPLLVLLWGNEARVAFRDMGIEVEASGEGNAGRLIVVKRAHPATSLFLKNQPDAFTDANLALEQAGWPTIAW